MDEGAVPLLPAQGGRLRRLPLPGVRLDGRCGERRSSLRAVTAPRSAARRSRRSPDRRAQLPPLLGRACHPSGMRRSLLPVLAVTLAACIPFAAPAFAHGPAPLPSNLWTAWTFDPYALVP